MRFRDVCIVLVIEPRVFAGAAALPLFRAGKGTSQVNGTKADRSPGSLRERAGITVKSLMDGRRLSEYGFLNGRIVPLGRILASSPPAPEPRKLEYTITIPSFLLTRNNTCLTAISCVVIFRGPFNFNYPVNTFRNCTGPSGRGTRPLSINHGDKDSTRHHVFI